MFYVVNMQKPHLEIVLGTDRFKRIIHNYILDISELTTTQYETFIGTLFALDLLNELSPDDMSSYVVRFSPDE